jgi:hypothetical protein
MNPIDHAKLLLLMASKDMKALDIMIMPESVDDGIFGFHAQQAVEKTLKAMDIPGRWRLRKKP